MKTPGIKHSAKNIAFIALMAATITGGKIILSFIPNVEIVTLLCAAYGYVFGIVGVFAVFIFVICETLIWGFGTWVISYFIYWPLLCVVFLLFGKLRVKNRITLTLAAVILTVIFGVLTSLIDVGLFTGYYDRFWVRFRIYYLRGITYNAVQVVCNAVCFLFVFKPFIKILTKLKHQKNISQH